MTAAVAWTPVRRHLRAVRRSHGTRSPRAILGLVYEYLLYAFIAGGVLVTALSHAIGTFATPSGGTAGWLAGALAVGGTACLATGLVGLGPIVAGPATASWLLPSPLRRRDLLGARSAAVVAGTAVLAAGVAALVAASVSGQEPLPVAGVGAAVGALIATTAVLVQTAGAAVSRWAAGIARAGLGLSLLAVLVLVLVTRAGGTPPPVDGAVPVVAIVAPAPAAVIVGVVAFRRLDRVGTPSLTRGAPLVAALWSSSVALDAGVATSVVEERRLRRRPVVRSRRNRRPGRRRALIRSSAVAALRHRSAWAWSAGLVVVPYAAALMAPAFVVPVVQLACATVVCSRFATALRAVAGSAALRRIVGGGDRELLVLQGVVPLLAVTVWTVPVCASAGTTASLLLLPLSALAVVARHATRPPRAATMTLYETPMGISIPVELVQDLSRGPTLFAVLAGIQMLLG
ncbi:DUF6297 family protein [Pseudonocardia endophytica]|uniref:ABC-2 type transport system permease protein n=1 Tax=Pseudonocardia endophytica TaxID=401976 RepID=A0A4R1HGK7_PSEEN|nr:DUF6297 family protein [Pseudonocardia endophytica]TCK21287.1 hypothetical protein EV378_5268 [Pseudonocardia endophytica]